MKREIKYDGNGKELLACSECGELKHLDMFYRHKNRKGLLATYFHRCKECEKQHQQQLRDARKEELFNTDEMFIRLGYEVNNPDNPIYRQFEKKWGL